MANKMISCFTLFLIWSMTSYAARDSTLDPDATGCVVAKASIEKVTASKAFQKDHHFLIERLALVSDFGRNVFTDSAVGIWQMTEENLREAQKLLKTLPHVNTSLMERFGIDFNTLKLVDIRAPFHNLITVCILIEGQQGGLPWKSEVENQLNHWTSIATNHNNLHFRKEFMESAAVLEANIGERDSECLICIQQPTDLVFVLDSSGSIGINGWRLQLQFFNKVIDKFEESLASGESQVGVVVFNHEITLQQPFISNILTIRSNLDDKHYSGGGTNILLGVQRSIQLINQDSASRKDDAAVRKLMFLLTDGNDGNNLRPSSTILTQLQVNVYAIGVTSGVNLAQLSSIASKPEYVRVYNNYNSFGQDIGDIVDASCKIASQLDFSDVIDPDEGRETCSASDNTQHCTHQQHTVFQTNLTLTSLQLHQTRNFELKIPSTKKAVLKIITQFITLFVYTAFDYFPNEAMYDQLIVVYPGTVTPVILKHKGSPEERETAFKLSVFVESFDSRCGTTCSEDVNIVLTFPDKDPHDYAAYTEEIFYEFFQRSNVQIQSRKVELIFLFSTIMVGSTAFVVIFHLVNFLSGTKLGNCVQCLIGKYLFRSQESHTMFMKVVRISIIVLCCGGLITTTQFFSDILELCFPSFNLWTPNRFSPTIQRQTGVHQIYNAKQEFTPNRSSDLPEQSLNVEIITFCSTVIFGSTIVMIFQLFNYLSQTKLGCWIRLWRIRIQGEEASPSFLAVVRKVILTVVDITVTVICFIKLASNQILNEVLEFCFSNYILWASTSPSNSVPSTKVIMPSKVVIVITVFACFVSLIDAFFLLLKLQNLVKWCLTIVHFSDGQSISRGRRLLSICTSTHKVYFLTFCCSVLCFFFCGGYLFLLRTFNDVVNWCIFTYVSWSLRLRPSVTVMDTLTISLSCIVVASCFIFFYKCFWCVMRQSTICQRVLIFLRPSTYSELSVNALLILSLSPLVVAALVCFFFDTVNMSQQAANIKQPIFWITSFLTERFDLYNPGAKATAMTFTIIPSCRNICLCLFIQGCVCLIAVKICSLLSILKTNIEDTMEYRWYSKVCFSSWAKHFYTIIIVCLLIGPSGMLVSMAVVEFGASSEIFGYDLRLLVMIKTSSGVSLQAVSTFTIVLIVMLCCSLFGALIVHYLMATIDSFSNIAETVDVRQQEKKNRSLGKAEIKQNVDMSNKKREENGKKEPEKSHDEDNAFIRCENKVNAKDSGEHSQQVISLTLNINSNVTKGKFD